MPYVIVMVGGDCEEYEGHDCVLWVSGPYKNKAEGLAVFEECRRMGERPHWMSLNPPDPGHAKNPALPIPKDQERRG